MSWRQGQVAEERVAELLTRRGFQLLARNHRCKGSEIDLLARRDHRLLLIEVKGRRNCDDPSSLLSRRKLQCLRRGLENWLQQHPSLAYESIETWLCCVPSDRAQKMLWFDLSGWMEQAEAETRKAFLP